MEQIHIMRGKDSFGPFTKEQVYEYLNQGALLPGDLAWHEGLGEWIPLEQLIAATAPTVEPPHPAQMPQPAMPSASEVYFGGVSSAPVKSKGKSKLVIAIVAGLLVLGGLAAGSWYFFLKKEPVQPSATNPESTKPEPIKGINQTSKVAIGTPIWEFQTGGPMGSSPAIGSDGTVYVGSSDNKLYAIKTDSKGLANSPWPMHRQNPLHTGRTK